MPAWPHAKKLALGFLPFVLVGLLFDAMRGFQNVGVSAASVHDCDLRAREIALFGVTVNGQPGTLHDWLQLHSTPLLDRLCAIPYAIFIIVCIACAMWLYVRDHRRMVRFGWCFFGLNVLGFVTYHLYPAAPPWYFHAHGCVVDMSAHASEGPNLARVDAWLGFPYFAKMYGKAAAVFGAMPSLHCAYACLVAVEGWATFSKPWRAASVAFYVFMCFSAVYLDHHWVLDALAGSLYCVLVVLFFRVVFRREWRPMTAPAVAVVTDEAVVPETLD